MKCPECGGRLLTINSRTIRNIRRRRYACEACERRLTTYEIPDSQVPDHLKPIKAKPTFAPEGTLTRRIVDALAELPGVGMNSEEVAIELEAATKEERKLITTTMRNLYVSGHIQRRPYTETGKRYEYFIPEENHDAED